MEFAREEGYWQVQVRKRFELRGKVQGVGFRPFVFRIASKLGLSGFVCNNGDQVLIELEGESLEAFSKQLKSSSFQIEEINTKKIPCEHHKSKFKIIDSSLHTDGSIFLSPDSYTCKVCSSELDTYSDHRYGYPFITCTNCGPRFSMLKSVPFDREHTSMQQFEPCVHCQKEYSNPEDRRFHSQTNSCMLCGPVLRFSKYNITHSQNEAAVDSAIEAIIAGKILCLKGIGGYHLLADATNSSAIKKLRRIKGRPDKPFAVMDLSSERVSEYCLLGPYERKLLESEAAPIVILEKNANYAIDPGVAPQLRHLGVMLAYTGLHKIISKAVSRPLAATSANLIGQGIYYQDDFLSQPTCESLSEYTLSHNREILRPVEDSVLKPLRHGVCTTIRRSRGFVPLPQRLIRPLQRQTLAVGSHLKNTFAIARGNHVMLSQHMGDLETYTNYENLKTNIKDWLSLFDFKPLQIVHDLHPSYLSTDLAKELSQEWGIESFGVQHHHAHIASCMAEHQLHQPIIGIALDGSGYGLDGTLWGGEFFVGDIDNLQRIGHLLPFRLLGGDLSTKETWRIALSLLWKSEVRKQDISKALSLASRDLDLLTAFMYSNTCGPLSSSCGRLFDGVSALCGLCQQTSYEGHAAILLEQAAYQWTQNNTRHYQIPMMVDRETFQLDWRPMLKMILQDLEDGVPVPMIASSFHHSLANSLLSACKKIRDDFMLSHVVLSGGVFMNHLLLNLLIDKLQKNQFTVHFHQKFPSNDGGLALGQIFLAANKKA